jgi:hypothetical protein
MRTNFIESRFRQRTPRGGLFLRLLEAFHRSRRREAIRVLRRQRHALDEKPQPRLGKAAPELP